MLKPKDFNYKADKVTQYYNEFEDSLLRDIAKFLLGADGLGSKAERELFILEQMGMNKDEITKRLATLTAQSESAVKEVLEQSVMTSFSNDKQVLDKYFNGDFGPLDNPAIKQTMDAEWVKTCGELENLTKTTMGAYNSTVVSALDDAEVLCASGAVSYSEAVTKVLDNIAATGLLLDYPTGTRRSLEAAVRCAVVTSMNQTAAQVTNQYIAEGGIEYVLVSAHTGARISDKGGLYSHAEWQGRAYKIRGSEEGFPNLLEATGYDIDPSTGNGTVVNPAGLHGYNCRHSHQPWDKDLDNPWVDSKGNLKVDAEEKKYIEDKQSAIDERIARIQADELYSDKQKERLIAAEEKRRTTSKYEDMQTQRRMESQIRDTKRQMVMKDAELDNIKHDTDLFVQLMGERKNLEHKLTNRNRVYGQYCADLGLTQQRDRLKVVGYTRKRNINPQNLTGEMNIREYIPRKDYDKVARETHKELETMYPRRKSQWNGKTSINNKWAANVGQIDENGGIVLAGKVSKGTFVHELLHQKSWVYYDLDTFNAFRKMEEGSIQLLTEEICIEKGYPFAYTYVEQVDALRTIAEKLPEFKNTKEFAESLYDIDMVKRYGWLYNKAKEQKILTPEIEKAFSQLSGGLL